MLAQSNMFPSDWATKSSVSRKRRTPETTNAVDHESIEPANTPQDFDVCRRILANLNKGCPRISVPNELNLDTLLTNMSYQALLCNMVGTANYPEVLPDLPIVTKAYEELFLRESVTPEKNCASGAFCEGMFIDPANPIILTEFLLPSEKTSEISKLCVLCSRKVTQTLYYDLIMGGHRAVPNAIIQRYGNICGPGEYAKQSLLICPQGGDLSCMPFPNMSHQRNRYTVTSSNHPKSVKQHRVAFEDFQSPSTNAQN